MKQSYHQNKSLFASAQTAYETSPSEQNALLRDYYRQEMDKNSQGVVLQIMYDTTTYNYDSLRLWISNLSTPDADMWLSADYLFKGNSTMAYQILENMPLKFSFDLQQKNELSEFVSLLEFLENKNSLDLSESDLIFLADYLDAENPNVVISAQNILSQYGQYFPPTYRLYTTGERKAHNKFPILKNNFVRVSPNPANEVVTFNVSCPSANQILDLVLTDVNGRIIKEFNIGPDEDQLTWRTETSPAGVYFYKLSSNGSLLDYGKVIIRK